MKKLIIGLLLMLLVLVSVGCTTTVEIFFPVQQSGFDQMTADLSGNLELDDGWLRLESWGSSYVLIWPYGFSVRGEDEEIQVIDGDGQVVAIEGEAIKVGGGEVASVEIVEMYIGKLLPDDCDGPFWIVSEVLNN